MTYNSLFPSPPIVAKTYTGYASADQVSVGGVGISYSSGNVSVHFDSTSDSKKAMAYEKSLISPIPPKDTGADIGAGIVNIAVINKAYSLIYLGKLSFSGAGIVCLYGYFTERSILNPTPNPGDLNEVCWIGSQSLVLSTGLVDSDAFPTLENATQLATLSSSTRDAYVWSSAFPTVNIFTGRTNFYVPINVIKAADQRTYGAYVEGETVNMYLCSRQDPLAFNIGTKLVSECKVFTQELL